MRQFACFVALVLSGSFCPAAQDTSKPASDHAAQAENRAGKDDGGSFGRIKEVKAGQKIVIQIDGAPDKTYNLADAQKTITIAEGLAVGDPVKVLETDKRGVKSVQIVRDVRPDAQRRDQERSRTGSSGRK
jgi:hypothetical protein